MHTPTAPAFSPTMLLDISAVRRRLGLSKFTHGPTAVIGNLTENDLTLSVTLPAPRGRKGW